MTRRELRNLAYQLSQTDEGAVSAADMDTFLSTSATAFARDVGGLHDDIAIQGTGQRWYLLPAGTTVVRGAWMEGQRRPLIEGDSTNGFPLNVARDPSFGAASVPARYVVEQAVPPIIWFDAPIRLGETVNLAVGSSVVRFDPAETAEPAMPAAYHEALAFGAARYAAMAMRDEGVAAERHRQFGNLVARFQAERVTKQPGGLTLSAAPRSLGAVAGRVFGMVAAPAGGGALDRGALYALLKEVLQASSTVRIEADDPRFTLTLSMVGGLTTADRDVLEGAVQLDSIRLSDRDLVFGTDGGRSQSVTTPGITVADEGHDLGTGDTVAKLNLTGAGVTAQRAADEVVINIPGASGGSGGVTLEQVDQRIDANGRVRSLSHFETALRVEAPLLTGASFDVAVGNSAVQVGEVEVPGAEPDRELVVSLPGVPAATFQLSAFLGKDAAAAAVVLDDGNSILVGGGGGVTFRLGRDATGRFLASASRPATYLLTVKDSRIDLEGFARKSSTALVPAAKLPPLGQTAAQVDAKIAAATETLDEFEESLRKVTSISDGDRVVIALSGTSYRISPAHPRVPSPDELDRKLRVAASDSAIDSAELAAATHTFLLKDLLAKPAARVYNVSMSGANALVFASKEGERMYLGRHSGGEFLVGSDQPGVTYHVYIADDRVDVRTEARHNGTLEALIQSEIGAHDAGGQTGAQVDARIAPFARAGGTARVPEDRLPQDLDDLLDAVDEAGWNAAEPADVRMANAFQAALPATLAAAQALNYQSVRRADVSPRQTNVYLVLRFTDDTFAERSKYAVAVQSAGGHVEARLDLGAMATVGTGGGFTYTALQIDDVPVGATVEVQRYDQFHVDRSKLDTGVPVGTADEDGFVLTRRAGGPAWEALRRLHGLRLLHDGPINGITIPATNAAHTQNLDGVEPAFDLDEHASGEFHAELVLAIGTRSATDLGWGSGGDDTVARITGLTFASTLAQAAAFVVGGTIEGVEVGSVDLYKGTVQHGTVRFFLGHDANNTVGYLLDYAPESGIGSGHNLAFGARLELSFLPSDAGAADNSHVGPLIATKPMPAGLVGPSANPAGAWVLTAAAPPGFMVSSHNSLWIQLPRRIPDSMLGFVARVSVAGVVTSQVYLPWSAYLLPNLNWQATLNKDTGSQVYVLSAATDGTRRAVRVVIDRKIVGSTDLLYTSGNNNTLLANTKIEFYQMV